MFREDIAESIGKILMNNGHKRSILGNEYVMYMKRYSKELAFYVKCLDKRKWNQGISVEMIFTTIETPDDSLFVSGVGIHIQILTVYEDITDDIMIRAGEKIVAMENSLSGFSDFVLNELDNPYFQTKRLSIYKRGLLMYKIIKEDEQIGQKLDSLKSEVCRLIRSQKTRQAYQRCHDFIKQLPDHYFEDKKMGLGTDMDISTFIEYIYAQCELDV